MLSAKTIRKARGSLTRAAFAEQIGVSPLTVYRWELPEDAKESRSPRGDAREKLEELVARRGSRSDVAEETHDGGRDAFAALQRAMGSDFRTAENELLGILSNAKRRSRDASALASTGLAFMRLFHHCDARGAFATLSPVLEDADEGRLSPTAAAYTYAIAAITFALPDEKLFDIGRANALAARVDELIDDGASVEARVLAWIASFASAFVIGSREALERTLGRMDQFADIGLPTHLECMLLEASSVRALLQGRPMVAATLIEDLINRTRDHEFAAIHARALANLATRKLDDLGDPTSALRLTMEAKRVAESARLNQSLHTAFIARAEGEALVRLGRFEEAAAIYAEVLPSALRGAIPLTPIVSVYMRFCLISGRHEAMRALATTLQDDHGRPADSSREACAAYARALLCVAGGDDPDTAAENFQRAERASSGWYMLLRDLLVFSVPVYLAAERIHEARTQLRRAQRYLDQFPSAWASAQLRRFEGVVLALDGRYPEARHLLEASIAAFELAEDIPDTIMARYHLAVIEALIGVEGAADKVARWQAELDRYGIFVPRGLTRTLGHLIDATRLPKVAATHAPWTMALSTLVVPLQRIATRGAAGPLIQRELTSVLDTLLPGRTRAVEEVDSNGEARILCGTRPRIASHAESFEFGDGAGRRYRLVIEGPIDDEQRAGFSILALAAGLALEVAVLRGLGAANQGALVPTRDEELPGFIAASQPMRRLRSELVRLSGSRATVVLFGESGTGKELVARALHDLSDRKTKPYVAFNAASVPRDLFEGQLFGYRRGAFTGATHDSPGVVRAADGGTLFLDEIGELPLDVQPKLLRFLENGEVFPLGDTKPVRVDVRVIAATHRDLTAMVKEGSFREDLYYRLQVVPIRIPPLRDRKDDILPLAKHFLRLLAQSDAEPPVLSPDAATALRAHSWPGNVRELRNVVERALAFAPTPRVLGREHLFIGPPSRGSLRDEA